MRTYSALLLQALLLLTLVGCGGHDPATQRGPTVTPPTGTPPISISGIAASGAALDGARVEVIDAAGALVDVGDALTGNDGSYQIELPGTVALPVIVRVTPPGGTPLLSIIPRPAEGTTEIIANINPITDLVSSSLLGDGDATDNAELAGALAVVDPATIEASGDAVVAKLLGSTVKYSSFSNDAAFVAKTPGSATPASATDAILDTLAKQARTSGTSVKDQLKSLNNQTTPPRLLEEPAFQAGLVSQMIKGGTASTDLESKLSSIGAIAAPAAGQPDVFRTIIETVPALMTLVRTETTSLADDADLLEVAVDAAVDLLADTINEKKTRYATGAAGLVSALKSPSLQQTVAKVVQSSVVPVLNTFVGSGSTKIVKDNLTTVVGQVTKQASIVASTFTYTETSSNVSNLVSTFVSQQVAPTVPLTLETLSGAASGAVPVVTQVGDANTAKTTLAIFAADNGDLIEGPVADLIEAIPAGIWDVAKWDAFNWG